MSLSTLVLTDMNCDFDGDALNLLLLAEVEAAKAYSILRPHMRLRATNSAEIGTNISLPKQTLLVLNSFLDFDE